ncbi:MAG TPA: metal-dependent transcriptional regulator [Ktedonobacterales bacterium]|nr:metal-dependent transcriptional regulator [Ktedonobacterales bacterium]
MEAPRLTPVMAEYLETIYNLAMEGEVVIGARLAERFDVAPPTVTETLKRLVRDGFVEMDDRRHVTLTPQGIEEAERILRRHRLTERLLVDLLGMPWHAVHEEALRLEHQISGAVEQRVVAALGQPTTCPHGNPIPGAVPNARAYLAEKRAFRLDAADFGREVELLLVSEVVEDEEELIRYLHERGITPGTRLRLAAPLASDASEAEVTLLVGERPVTVARRVAHALWVVQPVALEAGSGR